MVCTGAMELMADGRARRRSRPLPPRLTQSLRKAALKLPNTPAILARWQQWHSFKINELSLFAMGGRKSVIQLCATPSAYRTQRHQPRKFRS
jgi:hypothetical protein